MMERDRLRLQSELAESLFSILSTTRCVSHECPLLGHEISSFFSELTRIGVLPLPLSKISVNEILSKLSNFQELGEYFLVRRNGGLIYGCNFQHDPHPYLPEVERMCDTIRKSYTGLPTDYGKEHTPESIANVSIQDTKFVLQSHRGYSGSFRLGNCYTKTAFFEKMASTMTLFNRREVQIESVLVELPFVLGLPHAQRIIEAQSFDLLLRRIREATHAADGEDLELVVNVCETL
jgi:hypothetical protein